MIRYILGPDTINFSSTLLSTVKLCLFGTPINVIAMMNLHSINVSNWFAA